MLSKPAVKLLKPGAEGREALERVQAANVPGPRRKLREGPLNRSSRDQTGRFSFRFFTGSITLRPFS